MSIKVEYAEEDFDAQIRAYEETIQNLQNHTLLEARNESKQLKNGMRNNTTTHHQIRSSFEDLDDLSQLLQRYDLRELEVFVKNTLDRKRLVESNQRKLQIAKRNLMI